MEQFCHLEDNFDFFLQYSREGPGDPDGTKDMPNEPLPTAERPVVTNGRPILGRSRGGGVDLVDKPLFSQHSSRPLVLPTLPEDGFPSTSEWSSEDRKSLSPSYLYPTSSSSSAGLSSWFTFTSQSSSSLSDPMMSPKMMSPKSFAGSSGSQSNTSLWTNEEDRQCIVGGALNQAANCPNGDDPIFHREAERYSYISPGQNQQRANHQQSGQNLQYFRAIQKYRPGSRTTRSLDYGRFCVFCKRNKETTEFYSTHVLKDCWGKVICPVLRKYVCPICGATGDTAHTVSHCPLNLGEN